METRYINREMTDTGRGCQKKGYWLLKRCVDIIGAIAACTILFLPSVFVVLLIRLTSRGPVIYAQERLGMGGRTFVVYKFRTMHMDAEADGPQFAMPDDQRCTSIGAFLRKTRIDEWPQFWNVLKGDMSIVGPRPERAYFYQQFSETIPLFYKRLQIKPGLTGYAQVYGGLYLTPEEKLQYDLYYIEHCGVGMDIRCMLKTVIVVAQLLFSGDANG